MTTSFTLSATIDQSFDDAVDATRGALAAQGFGIVSEIDLAATFRAKLAVDVPPQIILGACRPELALGAVRADPSVAALLPCNVVVRQVEVGRCVVEAFDPDVMGRVSDSEALHVVAADARVRLEATISSLQA